MQVVNGLPPVLARIDDGPETIDQPLLDRNLADHVEQMAHERRIRVLQMGDRGDLLLRDHQDMHRSLGTHIVKGQRQVVLMDNLGRDFLVDDAFEDRLGHGE